MAFRFPGDLATERDLWRALRRGADMVGRIGPERWATEVMQHPRRAEAGRSITYAAGVLSGIDESTRVSLASRHAKRRGWIRSSAYC
jgi:acyl transferase domain-containing protein